ncbi:hypothetical protein BsWGS_15831 [Bradybaena similaris]
MRLLDLPTEILQHIASFLPAVSLAWLSETCRQLHDITVIDSLWQALSEQDFGVSSNRGWNLSHREIYTKVLCKLHGMLGLKRLALIPYGGLVNVCWGDGEIQVNRYLSKPGDQASSGLSSLQMFSLRWNEDRREIEVFCVQCPSGKRPAILAQAGRYPLLRCADRDCNISHIFKEVKHGQSDQRFKCGFDDHFDAFIKFNLNKGFNCPMLPLPMPSESDQLRSPVRLGLYTGDYGSHGVEILHFTISQRNPERLEGLKIVGDPNVPAGNVSVQVFLNKPIILSESDQESVLEMLRIDEQRSEGSFGELLNVNNNSPDFLRQPFIIPEDCFDRGQECPNTCLARYLAEGRIAGHLYNNPSTCKCHFIKFSDVKFGVMWLELNSFSMFYKVAEEFPRYLAQSS